MTAGATTSASSCSECYGTGRNRKGGPCKACRGTGRVGVIGAGVQFLGALLRVGFALALAIIILISIISSGGSKSHHRTAAPATATAPAAPSQTAGPGPEVAQCTGTLPFATRDLCTREWESAYNDFVLSDKKPADMTRAILMMPGLTTRCEQHDSAQHCGYLLGQSLAIAANSTY